MSQNNVKIKISLGSSPFGSIVELILDNLQQGDDRRVLGIVGEKLLVDPKPHLLPFIGMELTIDQARQAAEAFSNFIEECIENAIKER